MNDIEDRLRTAVHAQVDTIQPDEFGSLDTIRGRVRVARRRRRIGMGVAGAGLLAIAALVLPQLDDSQGIIDMEPADEAPTTTGPPTTETPTPDTEAPAAPANELDQALWPDPSGALFSDPSDAARSFVEDFMGVPDPPLSDFRETEPGVGHVDLFGRGELGQRLDRVASTIVLRQLDGENWFVTAAVSPDVTIERPTPEAAVSSPVTVAGRGRGYEGTVIVSVRERFTSDTLGSEPGIAGCCDTLEPYSVDLSFDPPSTSAGVIVAQDDPGGEPGISSFAAVGVRFGGSAGTAGGPVPPAPTSASGFQYQPLWPFASAAGVEQWQDSYRRGGQQPWHLDPDQTALGFTTGYLGFTEIDRVISREVGDTEAHVAVGYATEGGRTATAAVIHLVRWGTGEEAPWEVVGTRDTDLTLETPRYGAAVSSPVTVGGRITGVDENLRVQVRQPSSPQPLGSAPGLPAGGENSPWETTVTFSGATDPALTIVVSTGGHFQEVERFAITGVRP